MHGDRIWLSAALALAVMAGVGCSSKEVVIDINRRLVSVELISKNASVSNKVFTWTRIKE